ncbi:metal ABC transporter ATP-binding protein [Thalassoroseus pseudoceratinae]|uniref:metal ABC transporter ATP-binding protein n=1 Tax=Thalassoroseus pseudoceratinae TaxID=2713176 RepID=UPI00141EDFBB|nr:metal ABC transporter ATP-binding protein [Thalassoroseus pseudoceratinae]
METAIQTHQLTVAYGAQPAIWNVDVSIPKFGMTGILGPNGAGKSTFLKAILGTVPKLSGQVNLHELAKFDANAIGYVPQRNTVDWDFPTSVFDLVMMGTYGRLRWFQRPGKKEREATWEALRQVKMEEFADRQIGELSGGQQQRVFLARAFVQRASIYLMDEPFAGVDASTENMLIELLHQLRDAGNTIVLVHHDLTTVAEYFDHVVLLNRKLIACGDTPTTFTAENIETAYGVAGMQLLGRKS